MALLLSARISIETKPRTMMAERVGGIRGMATGNAVVCMMD